MKNDAISLTALLVLTAFAVERVSSGLIFLLSFWGPWDRAFPDPRTIADAKASVAAERRGKFVYFLFAGALVLWIIGLNPELRILQAIGKPAPDYLDIGLSWLVVVAGSDRIGDLVPSRGGGEVEAAPKPIQIEGQVTLVEGKDQ